MTINGYKDEKTALATIFANAWTETEVAWPGLAFKTPDSDTVSWVEFNIINGTASQISIGAPGANTFRHPGVVSIMIYVPTSKGEEEALRLADMVAEVYRGNQDQDDIIFFAPYINKLGVVRNYFQVNVTVPFNRDSLM